MQPFSMTDTGVLASELILWAGIATALHIIVVLLLPRKNTAVRANRYLALFISALTFSLLMRFFHFMGAMDSVPLLLGQGININLLLGPALLFYTREITSQHETRVPQYLHWLPAIVSGAGILMMFFWSRPPSVGEVSPGSMNISRLILQTPATVSLLAYGLYCIQLLKRHRLRLADQFSTLDQINLHWVTTICWILIFAALSLLVSTPFEAISSYWRGIVYVALIYYIGHTGIRQPEIFRQQPLQQTQDKMAQVAVGNSQLPPESQDLWQALLKLLDEQQSHLDLDLNLSKLSRQMKLHPNRLSAVINHHGRCNFFELINKERIKHAKHLLADNDCKLSIVDIALESGFNSKSTFYLRFKEFTGMSPTSYRNSRDTVKA